MTAVVALGIVPYSVVASGNGYHNAKEKSFMCSENKSSNVEYTAGSCEKKISCIPPRPKRITGLVKKDRKDNTKTR